VRRTVPGFLDLEALRKLHRPTERDTLRVCAVELQRRGMLPADIARALEVSEEAVKELLREPQLNKPGGMR
jgi:DNA-binding NarL/FixJ family response regulator